MNTFRCEEEENRKKNEDYDLEAGCIEESGKLSKDCDAIRVCDSVSLILPVKKAEQMVGLRGTR